jgi:amino acid adenylation domain-containing protein
MRLEDHELKMQFSSMKEVSIHEVFRKRVEENPSAIALVDDTRSFTYEELDALSSALARNLESAGAQQGDVVALMIDRSAELIVSMLAVLKCGAAYMPLDRNNPVLRNRYYLQEAAVHLVIANSDCGNLCDSGRLCYPISLPELRHGGDWALRTFSNNIAAYVMFTSGTSSQSKGVVVPHRAVTRLVVDTNYITIRPTDAILQLAPPSFDASTFEIWGALLNGAKLVLYTSAVLDPTLFKRYIVNHDVTIVWLTAGIFHLFVDKCLDALRPLRVLLAGGDVLYPNPVRRVIDEIEGITLINGYGPTENTTFTCCHVMNRSNRPEGSVPIGRPISGTQVFILNDERQEVMPGEIGELYAAGEGVALGYLNDDLKQSPFFHDARFSEGLLYRTGDLTRVNDRGLIEFIGRRDNQVKLRGFRVSLEEVRSYLIEIPEVKEAVVRCQSTGHDQILVAYLQSEADSRLTTKDVRSYLRSRLLPHMIPERITISQSLPITTNGKVDAKALSSSFDSQDWS